MDVEKALPRETRKKLLPKMVGLNRYNGPKDLWYGVPMSEEDIKNARKPKKVILRVSLDHIRLCFPKEERFEGKFIFMVVRISCFSAIFLRYFKISR